MCVCCAFLFPQYVPNAINDLLMLRALVLQESGARTLAATAFYEVSQYVLVNEYGRCVEAGGREQRMKVASLSGVNQCCSANT